MAKIFWQLTSIQTLVYIFFTNILQGPTYNTIWKKNSVQYDTILTSEIRKKRTLKVYENKNRWKKFET